MKNLKITTGIPLLLMMVLVAGGEQLLGQGLGGEWVQEGDWKYYGGWEFPGAKGSVKKSQAEDRDILSLFYDFTEGGAYVGAKAEMEIPEDASRFPFSVKADRPHKLVVRMKDSSGQTHQWPLRYEEIDTWQEMEVDLETPAPKSFGGDQDGVIHYPITEIMLCVAKSDLGSSGDPGEVWFAGAEKP